MFLYCTSQTLDQLTDTNGVYTKVNTPAMHIVEVTEITAYKENKNKGYFKVLADSIDARIINVYSIKEDTKRL